MHIEARFDPPWQNDLSDRIRRDLFPALILDRGLTVWLTGLSGSGKSTLARALESRLNELDRKVAVLDGDKFRKTLSSGLGYSKQDRNTNIRRIGYVASLLNRNGSVVIAAAISPYRDARAVNRSQIGRYVEVYCRCPLAVLESRDVKGLYQKARKGELHSFTGIDDPYEEPLEPEVIVDTDKETIKESTEKIWRILQSFSMCPEARIATKRGSH